MGERAHFDISFSLTKIQIIVKKDRTCIFFSVCLTFQFDTHINELNKFPTLSFFNQLSKKSVLNSAKNCPLFGLA